MIRPAVQPWLLRAAARPRAQWILALAGSLLLSACAVGPKYQQPSVVAPPAYKEAEGWQQAQPSDNTIRGSWWELFKDERLDDLEGRVNINNQQLIAAEDQLLQARELIKINRSGYYPTVGASPAIARSRVSNQKAFAGASAGQVYDDFILPAQVSWEPDFFNRVRYSVENARAGAEASQADLETLRLTLQAELATDYFSLRSVDLEAQILDSAVASFQRALQLTQSRYSGGVASGVDVAQAQTELQTTMAQDEDVQVERTQLEHAIAVLIDVPPAEFSLPKLPLDISPPPVPLGVPSDLLERRPDVASSERNIAAANANIGLARTAYYPLVTLSAGSGLESGALTTLLHGSSGLWSIGIASMETIFDAGRRHGITEQQRDAYDQAVANYRETVVQAFQEVEDNLSALRILGAESETQAEAVRAAQQSLQLSNNRYVGGVASYLEVTTAQSIALDNERVAAQLLGRRMQASVLLIKALGGGWDRSMLQASANPPSRPAQAGASARASH